MRDDGSCNSSLIGTSSSLPCSHIAPVAMLQLGSHPLNLCMVVMPAYLKMYCYPATAEDPIQYADVLKN